MIDYELIKNIQAEHLTKHQLTELFLWINEKGLSPKNAVIVFHDFSFEEPRTEMEKAYIVNSSSNAFKPWSMLKDYREERKLYGNRLDGKENHIRLDDKIRNEEWVVDYCYLLKD